MTNNQEALMERLSSALEELADLRLVLDELVHVLRTIQRDGLGVYDAKEQWFADGVPRPSVPLTSMPNDPRDPDWARRLNRYSSEDLPPDGDENLPLWQPTQQDLF
jgi:hypothetical protein